MFQKFHRPLTFIAFVGQTFTHNPQLVQTLLIVGLKRPTNSIAFTIQGSLQEKHIVFCHDKQDNTSISILASIRFLFSIFRTSFLQDVAYKLQYVQPEFEKSSFGLPSSNIFLIFSSHTVAQSFVSHFTQFVKKRLISS